MGRVFACAAAVARNKLHARFDVGADDFVLAIVKASTTKHTGELIAKVADSVGLRHKLQDLVHRRVPQAEGEEIGLKVAGRRTHAQWLPRPLVCVYE